MNRFLNGALIAIVAFVVLLGAMWAFARPDVDPDDAEVGRPTGLDGGASGTGSPAPSGTAAPTANGLAPSVRAVEASWSADGASLRLDMVVRNPSNADLVLDGLATTMTVDGTQVREAQRPLDVEVPARSEVPMQVTLPAPDDLAAAWWRGLSDGTVRLRVDGTLATKGAAADLPFRFEATASDTLRGLVAAAGRGCEDDVCAEAMDASWTAAGTQGPALRVGIAFDVDDGDGKVSSVTARLVADGITIASGTSTGPATDADGSFTLPVPLAHDGDGSAAWWPRHAAACEASTIVLELDVATADGLTRLELDAGTLRTGLVCGGA